MIGGDHGGLTLSGAVMMWFGLGDVRRL